MSELSWLIKPVVILGGIEITVPVARGAQQVQRYSRKKIHKVHKIMPFPAPGGRSKIKQVGQSKQFADLYNLRTGLSFSVHIQADPGHLSH